MQNYHGNVAKAILVRLFVLFALLSVLPSDGYASEVNKSKSIVIPSIKTDLELYKICSRDVQKDYFSETRCGTYIEGFLAGHLVVLLNTAGYIEHINNTAISNPDEKAKIDVNVSKYKKDFRTIECARSEKPITFAKAFLAFMDTKKAKGDLVPQGAGAFFWDFMKSCNKQ